MIIPLPLSLARSLAHALTHTYSLTHTNSHSLTHPHTPPLTHTLSQIPFHLHLAGKCGPVWDILNNVATVGCKKILYPFNGFWFSLGWFLSCGLFTTFISIKLVSLYRKEEDYDPM